MTVPAGYPADKNRVAGSPCQPGGRRWGFAPGHDKAGTLLRGMGGGAGIRGLPGRRGPGTAGSALGIRHRHNHGLADF